MPAVDVPDAKCGHRYFQLTLCDYLHTTLPSFSCPQPLGLQRLSLGYILQFESFLKELLNVNVY